MDTCKIVRYPCKSLDIGTNYIETHHFMLYIRIIHTEWRKAYHIK